MGKTGALAEKRNGKWRYLYVGAFPPPFGGVTVKNKLVFDIIRQKVFVSFIDTKSGSLIRLAFVFMLALLKRCEGFYIGVSGKSMKILSHVLYSLGRKKMRKSTLLVMGGTFADAIGQDERYRKWVKEYERILVETLSMKRKLEDMSLNNVYVFPNCRLKPTIIIPNHDKPYNKVVFYSQIRPEKGVDLVLEAAKKLPTVQFDFWGEVLDSYRDEFFETISDLKNCEYKGLFKADGENVYILLSDYDVFVFPTRWPSEGVPGALIEAKIAGIPSIVSDWAYNSELVNSGHDGIVMKNYDAEELVYCIQQVLQNPMLFRQMQRDTLQSAERYYVENYLDILINEVEDYKQIDETTK